MLKYALATVLGVALLTFRPPAAEALPVFAHEYGVTCAKCHTVIPHLNAFGAAFMASGYRIPGVKPGPAFPLSTKINLIDSSVHQGDGPDGAGLPKAIVDEVEVFAAGGFGTRASYLVEQYAVDGGMHGTTRDAWVIDRLNPWDARIPLYLQAGSFTLPLPVDPETFRDSYQGYALYEQTVGANPFSFFDPKIGAHLSAGDPGRGLHADIFAGPGHDRQSGVPSTGTDVMFSLADGIGPLALSVYRYTGTRPAPAGPERFSRTGYGIVWNQWGRFSSETVLQTGTDADCGLGSACVSSGGLTQLRYAFSPRLYALARYEGTNDPVNGFARNGVLLLGYGLAENARLTVEDVVQHLPQTTHTLNLQYTVAY